MPNLASRNQSGTFLVDVGDALRFAPIDRPTFESLEARAESGGQEESGQGSFFSHAERGVGVAAMRRYCWNVVPGGGKFFAASSSTSTQSCPGPLVGGVNSRLMSPR